MYKPAPAEIAETYLGPGQGIVGRIFAFTDRDGRAIVDTGDQKGVLRASQNKGYKIGDKIRFKPDKRRVGSIPLANSYCKIDPITGIPINAQDNSTYEGTIEHVPALGRILVYVIPTLESRNLGGVRTLLENAKTEEYQIGKPIGYIKKLGTNDKSDNYWIIEKDDSEDGSLRNDSGIDFVIKDQIPLAGEFMLLLSQNPELAEAQSRSLSVTDKYPFKIGEIEYTAYLVKGTEVSQTVRDIDYPEDLIASGNFKDPSMQNTSESILKVATLSPRAANIGGRKQKLERLVRSEARKLGIQL